MWFVVVWLNIMMLYISNHESFIHLKDDINFKLLPRFIPLTTIMLNCTLSFNNLWSSITSRRSYYREIDLILKLAYSFQRKKNHCANGNQIIVTSLPLETFTAKHAYAKIISSTNFNEYVQIQFTISLKQKV